MSKLSHTEQCAAVKRVQADGKMPLADLRGYAGVPVTTLLSWIICGRRGVHLDGVKDRELGWCSSREALERFRAKVAVAVTGSGLRPALAV